MEEDGGGWMEANLCAGMRGRTGWRRRPRRKGDKGGYGEGVR